MRGLTKIKSFNKIFLQKFPFSNVNVKDMTYEEKVVYYEKEFETIYKSHREKTLSVVNDNLTKKQKDYCDALFNEIITFKNINEKKAFSIFLNQYEKKFYGLDRAKVKFNYPEFNKNTINFWPKENPNWKNINLQASSSSSSSSKANTNAASSQKAEEKIEPEKKKVIFDVKLTSYDASKKIVLIKEVRALLNLGLKEAKELVESAPAVLKTGLKSEEADVFKEKLKDLCVIDIV